MRNSHDDTRNTSQVGRKLGTITNFTRWGFYTTVGLALLPSLLFCGTQRNMTELRTKNPLWRKKKIPPLQNGKTENRKATS